MNELLAFKNTQTTLTLSYLKYLEEQKMWKYAKNDSFSFL